MSCTLQGLLECIYLQTSVQTYCTSIKNIHFFRIQSNCIYYTYKWGTVGNIYIKCHAVPSLSVVCHMSNLNKSQDQKEDIPMIITNNNVHTECPLYQYHMLVYTVCDPCAHSTPAKKKKHCYYHEALNSHLHLGLRLYFNYTSTLGVLFHLCDQTDS